MKNRSWRSASFVPRLVGAVLFCAVGLAVLAGAGISSLSGSGRQPLFAPRAEASASLSNLALTKSGKLSSRLQQLSQPSVSKASAKTQAATAGLPRSGPGSLLRAAGGKQLIVYVRISGSVASASAAIENAGATIVNASKRYGVVTAAVDPSRLQALAKLPAVAGAREALAPMFSAACPSGPIVSEGDTQLAAASARSTYGVNGSGVSVGILSDSYNALGGASTGVSAGELPGTGNPCTYTTPVNVLQDDITSGNADEGRAMLEVVHDLAPGASLAFATANTGIYGMADNIRALRSAGARVIAGDVSYLDEPMFQEGPISEAIDDVTSSGASYFSAAGNANVVVGGRNVGSYEAPAYRPTSCPAELNAITGSPYYASCHDFAPGVGVDSRADYTLADNGYLVIDLQWAEPWAGVGTDLDIILIDADTGALLGYSVDTNSGAGGTQEPFELTGYQNTTGASENVEVVIARWSGTAVPRLKYVIEQSNLVTSVQYNSSSLGDVVGPTIFGHNGGQKTISVAAVPYNNSTTPESYSSHGPVTYYYGPVNGTTPAVALSSPLVLSKPGIAATDCAKTSFFYPPAVGGFFRFCGTSEAAPHAAAVAALMLQRNPAIAPAQVLARLQATAHAVTNGGTSDVVGSGLIDALGAVGVSTPTFAFSPSSYSVSETGRSAAITIRRTGATSSAVSVHVATANGTARAGSDYSAVSQNVSFAAGETSKTVSVPIIDAHVIGGSKTVSLALSTPSAGAELGWPSTATLTILDDDRGVAFSASAYSVKENGGSAIITVNRSGPTSRSDTVHFATANKTAKAGSDYKSVSQNVSFAAGQISKTISVPITNDKVHEAKETVSLTLSGPSLGVVLGSPSTATLTIVDNDKPGKITSARLTKKSFARVQARKVKLVLRFSPQSAKFNYRIMRKKGAKWLTVRYVKKTGRFVGKRTYTVKALFRGKSIKTGRYRLRLAAEGNSKTLAFRVT